MKHFKILSMLCDKVSYVNEVIEKEKLMSEYLSKEEIKQWRSSLEKITLEEFAARLGKKIEQEKSTNDIVDIVLKGKPVISQESDWKSIRTERISSIAQRAFEREKEIAPSPFSAKTLTDSIEKPSKKVSAQKKSKHEDIKEKVSAKEKEKEKENKIKVNKIEQKSVKTKQMPSAKTIKDDEINIIFNKTLTDREQRVFDYFAQNSNQIVYAKDLANLLDLPRDYVYKYIKNLRAKIDGEKLKNADKGGFILTV